MEVCLPSLLNPPHSLPLVLSLNSEAPNGDQTINDPFLSLLDQQLQGVSSSLLVCKWPVTLTSCFFVTLLSWEMAGDKGGWLQAVWVPIVGMLMTLVIRVCDHLSLPRSYLQCWSPHSPFLLTRLSLPRHNDDPKADIASTLEFVPSSLHQPSPEGSPSAALEENPT
jgi:hypothetical protein